MSLFDPNIDLDGLEKKLNLWQWDSSLKIFFFYWPWIYNSLPTDDNLQKCGQSFASICSHYGSYAETASHLLLLLIFGLL